MLFAGSIAYFIWWLLRLDGIEPGTGAPWSWRAGLPPTMWDVALFSVFALHHSLLARMGWRERVRRSVPANLERSTYVWSASLLFIVVCAAWRPVPGVLWSAGAAWPIPVTLQVAGGLATIAAVRRIDVLDLSGLRQTFGRDDSTRVVHTSGLYAIVRHPIYLAWIVVMWAARDMTGTRLVFAAVSSLYLAVAIPFEERDLCRTMGEPYRHYQRRIRWRLIPFVW